MSISLQDNLDVRNKKQNVERDSVKFKSDFKNIPSTTLPPVFHAMCEEDGCIYVYNVNNSEDVALGKWRIFESGVSGTAEDTIYENKNFPDYTNVNSALNALFNKVYYIKPTCLLESDKSGGTFENGTTISAPITFNWTTNKSIKTQTLTGCTVTDANVRTSTYNTDVTSDKTFTLTVGDGDNNASSSITYKFMNKIFWGSAPLQDTYDSDFILSLSSEKLTNSIKSNYSMNVISGQYGFIACPKSFNAPTECYIGGFLTTLDKIVDISFTNSKGYTTDYIILKTGKPSLGSFTMEFR